MVGSLFGKGPSSGQSPAYTGLDVQTSVLGATIPVLIGKDRVVPNLIGYWDFKATKQKQGGKGGGGGKSGGVSYTYSASPAMALCEGQLASIGTVWRAKGITTMSALGLTLFNGSQVAPWSYLTTKYPADAFVYPNTAYVAVANLQLGNSPTIGNFAFEAATNDAVAYAGEVDLDIASICEIVLTNTRRGVGFSQVASFTEAKNYCKALGLIGSLYQREQSAVRETLSRLARSTNMEFLWSGNALKLIPLGDSNVSGNGFSWTADTTPLFALGEADFLKPVSPERTRASDVKNVVKVEWKDRANQYNVAPAEFKDEASISQIGTKAAPAVQAHHFKKSAPALLSAQFEAARYTRRNSYRVPLDARYSALEPLDYVTLTDTLQELTAQPVRIDKVTISPDGTVNITAKERQIGAGDAVAYTFDTGSRAAEDFNAAAANVVAPYIFEPPSVLTDGRREVWIAVAGLGNWGGCEIWTSDDNATYRFLDRIEGPCRYGTISSAMTSTASPDVTNTPRANLSAVAGELTGTTTAGATALNTLAMVDSELIAYRDATLVSAGVYDLGYLIRGARGTTIAAHSSGAPFVRLDENIVKLEYDATRVGQTVYFKFVSFNATEGGRQDISAVTAYSKVLGGGSYFEIRNDLLPTPTNNLVRYSNFEKGTAGYDVDNPDAFTSVVKSVGTTNGKAWIKVSATSPGANKAIALKQIVADAFGCEANQKLSCEVEFEATGAVNYVYAILFFYDASNNLLTVGTIELKSTPLTFGTKLRKADYVVPSNSTIAKAAVWLTANCNAGAMTMTLTRPLVTTRISDLAPMPPYAPGPNNQPKADETAANTAAAITGQAAAATDATIEAGATKTKVTLKLAVTTSSTPVYNTSTSTWVDIASGDLTAANGGRDPFSGGLFDVTATFQVYGDSTLDRDGGAPGVQAYAEIDWRIVITDSGGTVLQTLSGGTWQTLQFAGGASAWETVSVPATDFSNTSGAGDRKIKIQIKRFDVNTTQVGGRTVSLTARYLK